MFIVSQLVLRNAKMCFPSSIPSYSVAIGLVLYATIYLYLLFYYEDYISVFNKFIIYIIGIDLLLSAFYHLSANDATQPTEELSTHLNNASNKLSLVETCEAVGGSQLTPQPGDNAEDTYTDTTSDISDNSTEHANETQHANEGNVMWNDMVIPPTLCGDELVMPLHNNIIDNNEVSIEPTEGALLAPSYPNDNQPPLSKTEDDVVVQQEVETTVTVKKRRGRPPKTAQ